MANNNQPDIFGLDTDIDEYRKFRYGKNKIIPEIEIVSLITNNIKTVNNKTVNNKTVNNKTDKITFYTPNKNEPTTTIMVEQGTNIIDTEYYKIIDSLKSF